MCSQVHSTNSIQVLQKSSGLYAICRMRNIYFSHSIAVLVIYSFKMFRKELYIGWKALFLYI